MILRTVTMAVTVSVIRLLLVVSMLIASVASAQEPVSEDKPFAEAFILLQLSDQDPLKQDAVLDIANNLIKHYGSPDLVDIEIVAFGPGMRLLLAGNKREVRISSLVESGVRFIGCMNTIDTMERKTGKRPELNEHTIPVQTGVAYIVEKVTEGYVLVRP